MPGRASTELLTHLAVTVKQKLSPLGPPLASLFPPSAPPGPEHGSRPPQVGSLHDSHTQSLLAGPHSSLMEFTDSKQMKTAFA